MNDGNSLTERQRRDVEDLNNEIAGRDVGRRARFLGGERSNEDTERKRREARAFQNRLLELLDDPVYRAKYEAVMGALNDAERATEAALDQLDAEIAAMQAALVEMEDRAARLPDGTHVFRDANGAVRRADGTVVEDHLAETILWTGQEPSFEDYTTAQEKLGSLEAQKDQVTDYQNDVLGPARDQLTDPDNPPSLDGLDDVLGGLQTAMPDVVRLQVPDAQPTRDQSLDVATIAVPNLGPSN